MSTAWTRYSSLATACIHTVEPVAKDHPWQVWQATCILKALTFSDWNRKNSNPQVLGTGEKSMIRRCENKCGTESTVNFISNWLYKLPCSLCSFPHFIFISTKCLWHHKQNRRSCFRHRPQKKFIHNMIIVKKKKSFCLFVLLCHVLSGRKK